MDPSARPFGLAFYEEIQGRKSELLSHHGLTYADLQNLKKADRAGTLEILRSRDVAGADGTASSTPEELAEELDRKLKESKEQFSMPDPDITDGFFLFDLASSVVGNFVRLFRR